MLNLMIAVLLENYNEFARVDKYAKWDHFQRFVKLWTARDPHSTGKIPAVAAYEILVQIGPPLGFRTFQTSFLSIQSSKKVWGFFFKI